MRQGRFLLSGFRANSSPLMANHNAGAITWKVQKADRN